MNKDNLYISKWIHFSGLLEMGFGLFFVFLLPYLITQVGVIFPVPFFIQASGIFLFFLGLTLYHSAKDFKSYEFVILILCYMRFTMFCVELIGAYQIWNLSTMSYIIGIAFLLGALYDMGSAIYTYLLIR